MNNEFVVQENSVFYNGTAILEFPCKVEKLLLVEKNLVVLLEYIRIIGERNVLCYHITGKFKWQIPQPDQIHDKNHFTGIYLRDGCLFASSKNGVEYQLDVGTGEILSSEVIN